jgi:hypothetical protein
MTTEKYFYEELARVPELPPQLYSGIKDSIRRHTLLMRTVVSLAAMLVLTIGVTTTLVSVNRSAAAISPEVASELQSIKDFGDGNDIPKDLATYAFYEGDPSR